MRPSPENTLDYLRALTDQRQTAVAKVNATRPDHNRYVVVVPISDAECWLHRYEAPNDVTGAKTSLELLEDYERKRMDNREDAIVLAGKWAGSFDSFVHVFDADNPFP